MPRHANESLTELLNNVQHGLDEQIVKVPESEFVRLYLPLLMGMGPRTPEGGINIQPWTYLVGGLHREAHIVDTQGQILWVIPPLFPAASLSTTQTSSFLNTITEARQTSNINPNAFDNAAIKAYSDGKIVVGKDTIERRQVWDTILAHYGLNTIDGKKKPQTNTDSQEDGLDQFFDLE